MTTRHAGSWALLRWRCQYDRAGLWADLWVAVWDSLARVTKARAHYWHRRAEWTLARLELESDRPRWRGLATEIHAAELDEATDLVAAHDCVDAIGLAREEAAAAQREADARTSAAVGLVLAPGSGRSPSHLN